MSTLITCPNCQDIVKLTDRARTCECSRVGGAHVGNGNYVYFGEPTILEVNPTDVLIAKKLVKDGLKVGTVPATLVDKSDLKYMKLGSK